MSTQAPSSVFSLSIDQNGNKATVQCRGRLVADVCSQLYQPVKQLLPASKLIVLDLRDLTHMDSMGLGTVVRLYVSARAAGSDLHLTHLSPHIRQILGVTHLLTVLTDLCEQGVNLRF
ncbi:MAG TPA: STAS domain-containing protein [Terracidiphilus sp.]|jgi:anti-sigma B factor antagonist|nr:STAS domain-containing protein [Terracidiphilus sp.]